MCWLACLLLFTAGLLVPASATAASPTQAIANLNGQRSAAGIPAGITENPSASAACAAHNNYERMNGGVLTHSETPGKPGYSAAGNAAAMSSVLSEGTNWNTTNPWETAPIHLAQLLDPGLDRMGVDDSNGFTCATTLPPEAGFRASPSTPQGYSYPGNGETGWVTQETAAEGPFTPGDLVGLPQPKTTGPYLFALFAGPWPAFGAHVTVSSATVTGPSGSVPIKIADGSTPIPGGGTLGEYIGATAMLIPVSPLASNTTYTAQLTGTARSYDGTSYPVSEQFSFTTHASPASLRAESHLTLGKASHSHGALRFTLTASGAYVGQRARVQVEVGGRVKQTWNVGKLRSKNTLTVRGYKHPTLTVTVSAFTVDGTHFSTKRAQRSA
jgi:Bacterial Ig-like domain